MPLAPGEVATTTSTTASTTTTAAQTLRVSYTTAQTDTPIITVATGTYITVTRILVTLDKNVTTPVAVRIGFGTANTPTGAGCVAGHPGLDAGGGFNTGDGSAAIGIGADDEDLRITCGTPTGGSLEIYVTYQTTTP